MSKSREVGSVFPFPKIFIQKLKNEWEEPIHSRFHVAQTKKCCAFPASADKTVTFTSGGYPHN